jgi:hypothetical protein
VSAGVALRQRVQQCLRLLQVGGVEALGEPAITIRQELAGLVPPASLLLQPTLTHGRRPLQRFGLVAARDGPGRTSRKFRLTLSACLAGCPPSAPAIRHGSGRGLPATSRWAPCTHRQSPVRRYRSAAMIDSASIHQGSPA